MTREELKEHCEKQIRACEMWAHSQGERPCGKVYEEHKLILELLEQEPTTKNNLGVVCISKEDVIKTIQRYGIGCFDSDDFVPEYCERFVIAKLNELPTNRMTDYRRAFKIACELLNGATLYGVDTDKIFEIMMKKDGIVSNSSYEEYILNHLQELDHGQYKESGEEE